MKNECAIFLQWALPHLKLRWPGFRKVRKQVSKRIRRRLKVLGLKNYEEYMVWLQSHPSEWDLLDEMCRISISTFYRDWAVFDFLKDVGLPQLAGSAIDQKRPLRCWSAGCASGEEPYTLSLIWHLVLKEQFPNLEFQIIATDADEHLLKRAKKGCYQAGTLKGLPENWLNEAFDEKEEIFCIQSRFKENIRWFHQDIRQTFPECKFDLLLCRNLIATYFIPELQQDIFNRMKEVLLPNAMIILGCHEKLPEGLEGYTVREEKLVIYQLS